MIQVDTILTALDPLGPLVRIVMESAELAAQISPGRFVLADLGDTLRTVLFPAPLMDPASPAPTGSSGEIEVLVPPDHPLNRLAPGARVNVIGPLGQGYRVPPETTRLLLVADTPHLPVLLPLALRELARGCNVALILTASDRAALFPIRLLPPALEVYAVTNDRLIERQGDTPAPFPQLARWAHCICLAHDAAVYPALAESVRQARIGSTQCFAQALIVPPLACGVGACQGCAVETRQGVKLACSDGPVFDLLDLQ